jgi:hypothetical protein
MKGHVDSAALQGTCIFLAPGERSVSETQAAMVTRGIYDPYRVGPSHRYRNLGLRPRLLERALQARRVGCAMDLSGDKVQGSALVSQNGRCRPEESGARMNVARKKSLTPRRKDAKIRSPRDCSFIHGQFSAFARRRLCAFA